MVAANADRAVIDRLADTIVPVLVVIDYAETRVDQLRFLVRVLTERPTAAPARLLLLARSADTEDGWWSRLRAEFRDALGDAVPTPLQPLEPVGSDRAAAFRRIAGELAESLREVDASADWPTLATALEPPHDIADDR